MFLWHSSKKRKHNSELYLHGRKDRKVLLEGRVKIKTQIVLYAPFGRLKLVAIIIDVCPHPSATEAIRDSFSSTGRRGCYVSVLLRTGSGFNNGENATSHRWDTSTHTHTYTYRYPSAVRRTWEI